MTRKLALPFILILVPALAFAQTYAIRNARIVTVSGATIPNGNIIIQDGVIQAVGANVPIPKEARIVDGKGLTAFPGMIDPHTSIGLTEIGSVPATQDMSEMGDLNPHMKASVAVSPHSEHIPITRANGVTTVVTAPGGGLFSGQAALINLNGWVTREMLVKDSVAMVINFPREIQVSASTPERQRRDREEAREKRIDQIKQTLRDAQAFAKLVDARVDHPPNLMMESLVPVVKGQMPVLVSVESAQEIKEALAVTEEFKLKAVLSGCSEAWKVIDDIKKANASVLLGSIESLPLNDSDPYDSQFTNAAQLSKAGVKFAITAGGASNTRELPFLAGMASAFGLPKEEALKAVTIYPAQILGIADRLGSLEEGKIANIMLMNGDPLELATQVRHLFIAGKPVDLKNKHSELFEIFMKRPR